MRAEFKSSINRCWFIFAPNTTTPISPPTAAIHLHAPLPSRGMCVCPYKLTTMPPQLAPNSRLQATRTPSLYGCGLARFGSTRGYGREDLQEGTQGVGGPNRALRKQAMTFIMVRFLPSRSPQPPLMTLSPTQHASPS